MQLDPLSLVVLRTVFQLAGVLLFSYSASAFAQVPKNMCSYESCKVGTRAATYFKDHDLYYACPTREIAAYVTVVIGLISTQIAVIGVTPKISRTTGEPEYEGESKALLDSL